MDTDNLQPFDKLIDSALRSEPMRDVPAGFSARVMERVSAEVSEQTRHAAGTHRLVRPLLITGVLAALIVVPMAAFYGQWSRPALPGGMGLLDYALAWVDLSLMSSLTDMTFVSAAAITGGVLLVGGLWAVTRSRGAQRQTNR